MKKLFVLAFAMAMTMAASAQVTWNAKLGIGMANCAVSNGEGEDMKLHLVGKAGVGLEYPLTANLSLMPSLEFAVKGYKVEYGDGRYSEKCDLMYLQVPVVAAYRFNLSSGWNLAVKVGPYFAYGIKGNAKFNDSRYDEDEKYDPFEEGAKRFDAGLDVGIDFEHHRYVIGLEYERGFVSLSKTDVKIYNQAFYLTVGYKF